MARRTPSAAPVASGAALRVRRGRPGVVEPQRCAGRRLVGGAYAQRITRIADADDVVVHHLDGGLVLAEVVAPARVGPDPGDLARGPHETRIPMAGQVTSRGDVLTTTSEARVGGRAILVTAHVADAAEARRFALVDHVLPALHAAPGVRGVRAHLTDGRQGDSILGDVIIVEARTSTAPSPL